MPAAGGEAADQRRRRCRLPLPLLPLLLCLAAPAAAQSPAPGPAQQEADPEAWRHLTGTVTPVRAQGSGVWHAEPAPTKRARELPPHCRNALPPPPCPQDEPDVFLWRVEPLNGTNPALVITLTHEVRAAFQAGARGPGGVRPPRAA